MKYCQKCGGEVSNFAIECGHCGASMINNTTTTNNIPNANQGNTNGNMGSIGSMPSQDMGFNSYNSFGFEENNSYNNNYSNNYNNNYSNNNNNNNNYSNNNYNMSGTNEASKKANKMVGVIGVLFIVIAAVVLFVVFKVFKGTKYPEQTKVIKAMSEAIEYGDGVKLIDCVFCNPIVNAIIDENGKTKQEMGAAVGVALMAGGSGSMRNIRVLEKYSTDTAKLNLINRFLNSIGAEKLATDAYEVKTKYQAKRIGSSKWQNYYEYMYLYEYDGQIYVWMEELETNVTK